MPDPASDPNSLGIQSSTLPAVSGTKALLTEHEVAGFLRVSREAILRFKRDRADPIPCYKVGRRYLYDPNEVLRWARRQADRAQRRFRHPV